MAKNIGGKFDDFLKEEQIFDEVVAVALKRTIAFQVGKTLEKKHLTKTHLAQQMRTSRAEVNRILDPGNTIITLRTIVKLAHVLGKKVRVAFA
jgi:antitoxin HicB